MKARLLLSAAVAALLLSGIGPALAGGSSPPGIVQSGAVTAGHCAQFSGSGVAIDSGATCGAGTAGVSQAQGTANQVLINGDTAAHTGATTFTLPPQLNLGTAGTAQGAVQLAGATAGAGLLQPPATATGLAWTLPTVSGTLMVGADNLSEITSAATARTNLGLGTSATVNTGTSGATIPLLNGNLTFSGTLAFTGLSAGTQVSCLGLDSGNHVVLNNASCGTGSGGGSVSITSSTLTVSPSPLTGTGTIDLPAIASHDVLSNITAGSAAPIANTLTATIDAAIGSTRGAILERGASGWQVIAPGTSGFVWTSNGAAADPSYQALAAVTSIATNNGITGGTITSTGTIGLAAIPANTLIGNGTGSSAVPQDLTLGTTLVMCNGNASVCTTTPVSTKSADYTIAAADMGGVINLTGTHTLFVPTLSSSVLASGMSVCYANQGTGNWTLSSTPTVNGLSSTTIPPGGSGCLVSNGTTLDYQPGVQFATTSIIGSFLAHTCSAGNFLSALNTDGTSTCGTPAGGGTVVVQGAGTLPVHTVIIGAGSQTVLASATGGAGIPFIGQGASADPIFGTAAVAGGGTGATTLAAHGFVLGEGTSSVNTIVCSGGQIPIGASASDPTCNTLGGDVSMTSAGVVTVSKIGGVAVNGAFLNAMASAVDFSSFGGL